MVLATKNCQFFLFFSLTFTALTFLVMNLNGYFNCSVKNKNNTDNLDVPSYFTTTHSIRDWGQFGL